MDVILTPAEKMGVALARANARAEAAEAAAAECRAERAAYGDNVAGKLGALENECERLRAALAESTAWVEAAKEAAESRLREIIRLRAEVATLTVE